MKGVPHLIRVFLFSARRFSGRPRSREEEGRVRWFHRSRLPFDEMWDDRYWVHLMLSGFRFDATFYYDGENRRVAKFEMRSRTE
jgi:hypothetical protein